MVCSLLGRLRNHDASRMYGHLYDWLRKRDRSLRFQPRKIALLVDNCSAHGDVEELKCIEVVKLPPNTTSVIQAYDMDIIRTFKAYCCREI